MRLRTPWRVIPLLLVLLVPSSPEVRAQSASRLGAGAGATGGIDPLAQLRQRLGQSSLSTESVPLEGAVDEDDYIIGPGDIFSIVTSGLAAEAVTVPVAADGQLVLPDIGGVRVAGLSLAEARRRALAALKERYRNVQVDVALLQPRQFYVHVSGAVPVPGRHLAMPVSRVSGVLEQAFLDTLRSPVANLDFTPSLRNITLVRQDGSTRRVDLLRYFATGNTEYNPYLRDGDIVQVSAYRPDQATVFIYGDVVFPGSYDHRPEDTVLDLLALATGSERPEQLGTVRLTRSLPGGGRETETLNVADLLAGRAPNPTLQPLDHLFVVPAAERGGVAQVEGWVHYPGAYPIEPGRTTLDELLEQAGGLREEALARGAYLERASLPTPEPLLNRNQPFARQVAVGYRSFAMRPDTAAVVRSTRLTDLSFLSRAYFAQEMRLQNRVSIDLEATLSGASPPVYLQDGDRLVVPRDDRTVYVFGQVNRPGYVRYEEGIPADRFIAAAGGPGIHADRAYVIEAGTGRAVPAEQATVQSGDVIFLDRRIALADNVELQSLVLEESRARADARIRTTQTILQVLGTAATLATTYLFIRNN